MEVLASADNVYYVLGAVGAVVLLLGVPLAGYRWVQRTIVRPLQPLTGVRGPSDDPNSPHYWAIKPLYLVQDEQRAEDKALHAKLADDVAEKFAEHRAEVKNLLGELREQVVPNGGDSDTTADRVVRVEAELKKLTSDGQGGA